MKTTNVVKLYNEICTLQTIKKTLWEFNCMMIEVKKVIRSTVDNYSEKLAVLQEEITELRVEHCQKDQDGNVIVARRYNRDDDGKLTITEEQYVGLVRGEKPEFDIRFKTLNEEIKKLGNNNVEIEERFAEIKQIKRNKIPVDWNGLREEIFWDFIEENKKQESTE